MQNHSIAGITSGILRRALGAALLSLLALGGAVRPAMADPAATPTKIFVVNRMDSSVSLVDLATMKEVRRIHVGPLPYYAQLSGDESVLAVTVEGDEKVKFYDTKSFEQRGEVKIGRMYAEHMVTTPDGNHVIIANRYGNAVVGINLKTMKEEFRVPVSSPHNLRLGASGRYLYVNTKIDPGVAVIDLEKRAVRSFYQVKFIPRGLAVSPDEKTIYVGANWVNGMFELDATTGKLVRFDQFPLPPGATKVQESTYHGFESVNEDIILGTNEGLSALDVIDARSGTLLNRSTDVSNPGAILMVPGTKNRFVVTNMGSNTVQMMELRNGKDFQVIASGKVGQIVGDLPKRFVYYYQ